jgi:hypothetical protein
MPDDLLIGLDSPGTLDRVRVGVEHLDALQETLEHAMQTFEREVRKAAGSLRGSAKEVLELWRSICRVVIAGDTGLVHAKRERILEMLRARAEVLKRVCKAAQRTGKAIPDLDRLLTDSATIERLHEKLTRRWQDAESLEYLVAEEIGPSGEQLKALAAKHPPTQAWFDQDDDPFQE